MDPISYSKAAQQEQRIKKIVADPDSVAGLVSVPNLVPTGETITIPAGRTVVHPNLQVDGTLDVQGSLFVPAGGTLTEEVVQAAIVEATGTSYMKVAVGTTAQRPVSPTDGQIRYNTDLNTLEGYSNGTWGSLGGDASETVKGIIEIATDAEVQAGTDTVRAITPSGLKSAVIGLGQTWQDVKASRVAGTTYTNSTGKPILLSIEADGAANICSISVNGAIITKAFTSTYSWATMTAIVPNGATYMVTSPVTICIWHELR